MYALDVAGRLAGGLDPIRWVSACRCYDVSMRDGNDAVSFLALEASGYCCLSAAGRCARATAHPALPIDLCRSVRRSR